MIAARLTGCAVVAALAGAAGRLAAQDSVLSVARDGCSSTLEVDHARGYLRLRTACGLGPAVSTEVLASLLERAFPTRRIPASVRSFFLGRTVDLPWLAGRMAVAAARSPEWDARRGRPREGTPSAFFARLVARDDLIAELTAAFAPFGVRLAPASVEKVLIARPAKIREFHDLDLSGVGPEDRVPFDALTWYRLVPIDSTRAP
ncbi:MAG: hypothetical protein R2909_14010 [Gemmatimonadales bacterium]